MLDKLTYSGRTENLEGVEHDPPQRRHRRPGGRIDTGLTRAARRSSTSPPRPTSTAPSSAPPTSAGRSSSAPRCCWRRCAETGARFVQVSTDEVYGDLEDGGSAKRDRSGRALEPVQRRQGGRRPARARLRSHVRRRRLDHARVEHVQAEPVPPRNSCRSSSRMRSTASRSPSTGTAAQVRDWLHVEDNCAGIELVLREGRPGEIYNVGGGNERENVEITRQIVELTGADPALVRYVHRPAGPRPPVLAGFVEACAWTRVGSRGGISKRASPQTVEWYRGESLLVGADQVRRVPGLLPPPVRERLA